MKIKTSFLVVCALALFFTSCEKNDFFTETADNAALKSAEVKWVPFKGELKIWIESFKEDGPDRNQVMVGTGNITHLGKTTLYAYENISIESWTGVEEITFTAANGDKLNAILTNVINPAGYPLLVIEGEGYFSGGTGRFENAKGTLHYHATFHVDDNKGEKVFTGMISNVGSSKSNVNAWSYKTPMTIGRGFTSGAIIDNKIYVLGGFPTQFSVTSSMEMYDPAKDKWIPRADMPAGLCAHSACSYNGKIYVFGGVTPDPYAAATKNVFVYDPKNDTWTQKNDMPFENAFFGIAVVDDMIYLTGGMQNAFAPPISTLMAYNPSTDSWTEKAPMPTARGMLSACSVNGKIYVIGGTVNLMTSSFDLVEVYDPATDTWTSKAVMPTSRLSLATCVMKDKIYAVGGYASVMYDLNEMYNPGADKWVTKSPLQQTRQTCYLGSVGNKMYAIGGSYLDPVAYAPIILSSVEEYDFSKD